MDDLFEIPLFAPLSKRDADKYTKMCLWKEYEANELIIDIDEETTDVRFVVAGMVRVINRFSIGKEVILSEMQKGNFFGELAAIDSEARSANITTLNRSKICIMPQKIFLQIIEDYPAISLEVMRVLTNRIRSLNNRLGEQSFLQAKHRLYAELLRLSKPRLGHEGQRSISPPPTQKELAERIGTRREVVSRELNSLQKQGIFEKTRGALVLIDIAELQSRISSAWDE